MQLNRYGEVVQKWRDDNPNHFSNVETGAFVIMPNHVHGIIIIVDRMGAVSAPFDTANPQHNVEIHPDDDIPSQQQGGEKGQGGGTPPLRGPTLGQIVAYFKYKSTKEINIMDGGRVAKLWQRNYYEHILRNEREMENNRNYIETNPALWETDDENPIKHQDLR